MYNLKLERVKEGTQNSEPRTINGRRIKRTMLYIESKGSFSQLLNQWFFCSRCLFILIYCWARWRIQFFLSFPFSFLGFEFRFLSIQCGFSSFAFHWKAQAQFIRWILINIFASYIFNCCHSEIATFVWVSIFTTIAIPL